MAPLPDPDAVARWADSGAAALTGRPDGPPLGPPAGLVRGLDALARAFAGVDPLRLLTERAAIAGLGRRGRSSCGGACRLLDSADGPIAVSLPRAEDVDLLPAWLEVDPSVLVDPATAAHEPPWDALSTLVRSRPGAELEERAVLLGLAVGRLGATPARPAVARTALGAAEPCDRLAGLLVVDLTSLWAGPLCGALLAAAGADVVKVESTARPDGARSGPAAFFDLLNGAKRSVALDFGDRAGVAALHELVARADIVLEASRPRALRQLGLDADALVAAGGPRIWVSITGHGRDAQRDAGRDGRQDAGPGDGPGRIGFGDDAAVAGGLVADDPSGPVFCADAVGDPCAGLAAASAVVDALAVGGRWLLDVSMAAVAASLAGPTLALPPGTAAPRPTAPPRAAAAPPLGAHTATVLDELGVSL
ncbi:MAG: CoA transferase [Acidimicrobiales bacterium]|nr:CoA transferase [Acidimicrobiales bacterium]